MIEKLGSIIIIIIIKSLFILESVKAMLVKLSRNVCV